MVWNKSPTFALDKEMEDWIMAKKKVVLVSLLIFDNIEPFQTKAFTNKDEANKYFARLVRSELSKFYDCDEDVEDKLNKCLVIGDYINDFGTRIVLEEIELYDDN